MYEFLSATQCLLMKDTVGTQDGKIKMEGKLMEKKKTVIYLVYTKGQTLPIP